MESCPICGANVDTNGAALELPPGGTMPTEASALFDRAMLEAMRGTANALEEQQHALEALANLEKRQADTLDRIATALEGMEGSSAAIAREMPI